MCMYKAMGIHVAIIRSSLWCLLATESAVLGVSALWWTKLGNLVDLYASIRTQVPFQFFLRYGPPSK